MLQTVTRILCIVMAAALFTACAVPGQKGKTGADTGDKTSASTHYNEAIEAAKAGDADKAIALFKKVTRAAPDFAAAYTQLGLQYLQKNKLDEAEQAFEKSITLNVTDSVAYNHRGVIMRKRGDFMNAKAMYQEAIKHNPDYANAHLNIAVLYDIYLYDLEQAQQHYRKYQALTDGSDKLVSQWLVDLERRIAAKNRQKK